MSEHTVRFLCDTFGYRVQAHDLAASGRLPTHQLQWVTAEIGTTGQ